MELTYIKEGDYLLPDLTLENKSKQNIGKYGLLRLNYLKQHKRILYCLLLTEDNLEQYLVDIDVSEELTYN